MSSKLQAAFLQKEAFGVSGSTRCAGNFNFRRNDEFPELPMTTSRSKESNLALVHEILAPLCELAAILGLSVAETEEALRYQFVRSALRRLSLERDRRVTFSDVSVITGLDRKQVTRLLARREPEFDGARASAHRAARVLSAWFEDVDYRRADGRPRDLAMDGPFGFGALVSRYAGDVPPRSVLDELLLREAVRVTAKKEIRALKKSATASRLDGAALERAGKQTAQLLRALAHNFSSADPGEQMFIRDIEVTDLAAEDLAIAQRDARSFLEPALDTVMHVKRRRYSRPKARSGKAGTLSVIVCISTAQLRSPHPDKQPQQHRKPRAKKPGGRRK